MRLVEDGLVFGAESRQFVDVEKTAIVNVVGCHPPLRKAVRLRLDEFVQHVERAWILRLAVNTLDIFSDELATFRGTCTQSCDSPLLDFLLAIALSTLLRSCSAAIGKMIESRHNALQLEEVFVRFTQLLLQAVDVVAEDTRILSGIDGEAVLEIEDAELAAFPIKCEFQIAFLEGRAVLIGQDRNQHFSLQFIFNRVPIDVEEVGVIGGFSVFKNIEPPRVVAAHDTHVIRDDVENLAHPMTVQLVDKSVVVLAGTDLGIQSVMVDDVVSVQTAGPRAQVRRGIDMADAESAEVGNNRDCVAKREMLIELQAVGRSWDLILPLHEIVPRLGVLGKGRRMQYPTYGLDKRVSILDFMQND